MPKTFQTNAKTITVHEMTTAELRTWWNGIAAPGGPCDIASEYAVPGISLGDLAMLCHCEVADFDDLTASELAPIAEAARELNPHFFRLRESLAEASARVLELLTEAYTATAQGEAQ